MLKNDTDQSVSTFLSEAPVDNVLHLKFAEFGTNAKKWTRRCALLLPEIQRRELWRSRGFSSIYEYAAKLAGMSRNSVDDALRILKNIEDKPLLQKVVEEKGLNAVRPVSSIATKETEEFWAKKVMNMSKNTLQVYVSEFRGLSRTGTEIKAENNNGTSQNLFSQSDKILIQIELREELFNELEKLRGKKEWNEFFEEFVKARKNFLKFSKPKLQKTANRYIPALVKNYVVATTAGNCAFPNCKRSYKILHHADRFEFNKRHDPDRIFPLCEAHERLAHLGLIENENLPAVFWKIRKNYDTKSLDHVTDTYVSQYRH